MNKKTIIIIIALTASGCTGNYKCTDTFTKSTCTAIFNGISNGIDKHNQREAAWREYVEMEKFVKQKLKAKNR